MDVFKPTLPHLQRGQYITNGLVGCWPMYEGSGNVVHDVSGGDNHGAMTNYTDASWVARDHGSALEATGVAGYELAVFRTSTRLKPVHITISMRCFIDNRTNTQIWYLNQGGTPFRGISFVALNVTGHWSFQTFTGTFNNLVTTVAPTTGKWIHMCATYDGINKTIYEDGVVRGTAVDTGDLEYDGTATQIGHAVSYDGRLSELRVYDRGLSASEVHRIAAREG